MHSLGFKPITLMWQASCYCFSNRNHVCVRMSCIYSLRTQSEALPCWWRRRWSPEWDTHLVPGCLWRNSAVNSSFLPRPDPKPAPEYLPSWAAQHTTNKPHYNTILGCFTAEITAWWESKAASKVTRTHRKRRITLKLNYINTGSCTKIQTMHANLF